MSYSVLEGRDFAGKSTLAKKLSDVLGYRLVAEPFTETPNAARVKQAIINNEFSPETEIFMLASNRLEAFDSVITPYRHSGVIADRSVVSTMVYQQTERWSQLTILDFMERTLGVHHDIYPDHLFFLDIDHETYLDRLSKADRIADEKEKSLMIKENWDEMGERYRSAIEWLEFREAQRKARMKVHYITPETPIEEIVAIIKTKK